MSDSQFNTADLCDQYADDLDVNLQIVAPVFRSYGNKRAFSGTIATLQVFEDNSLVREMLSEDGHGKVLIVDGGGSLNCSLLGDQLAEIAAKNGWSGIVIHGCIRDSDKVNQMNIGVRALNTYPKKTVKKGIGEKNITISFAGATYSPGYWVYADSDGIIVSSKSLL